MSLRLTLLILSGALAAALLALVDSQVASAAPAPAAHTMPWRRTAIDEAQVPRPGDRSVLLYVSASCPHCEGVTRYVDSTARYQRRPLLVISADAESTMHRWMARTGVSAVVVRDTSLAMRRALDVRFVPALVAWDSIGVGVRVTGADRRPIRRALEATR